MSNVPSQANTVANAMKYGQAGYNMNEQAKADLSNAIGQATSFMPASKSGIDSWNIATGGANTSSNLATSSLGLFGVNPQGTYNTTNGFNSVLGQMIGSAQAGSHTSAQGLGAIMGGVTGAAGAVKAVNNMFGS